MEKETEEKIASKRVKKNPTSKKENVETVANKTNANKFIIFRRCGKAKPVVSLPNCGNKLKLAHFSSGKGLELAPGDVVNTPKQNQLLVVSTYSVNPDSFLDIEKSNFEVAEVIGHNLLTQMECIKLEPHKYEDDTKLPIYSINGRLFKQSEIIDTLKAMMFSDEVIDCIQVDSEEENKLVLPNFVTSILGTIKKEFCNLATDTSTSTDNSVPVTHASDLKKKNESSSEVQEAASELQKQYEDFYKGYHSGGFED